MLKVNWVSKNFYKKNPSGHFLKDFLFPSYEKFKALNWISFDIKQWEKVAFIWPNWAGKSTTIKAILGILHYDWWSIQIFWMDPKEKRKKISKKVSSVFGQRSQLLYHLPLIESFKFFRIVYDIPQEDFDKRLAKFTKKFWLSKFLNTPVRKLSLGQRMKGEIISSILHRPQAVFLDEPTVWLDLIAKKAMYETLLEIHVEENMTIFLTSHDINDVEALCDRGIVINNWDILFDNSLEELLQQYSTKKIIKFKEEWWLKRNIQEIENQSKLLEEKIKYIFDNHKVEDLKVENIQLEEIIEQFYK